jgi:hypothetical protein
LLDALTLPSLFDVFQQLQEALVDVQRVLRLRFSR